jgi:hypothetical protein
VNEAPLNTYICGEALNPWGFKFLEEFVAKYSTLPGKNKIAYLMEVVDISATVGGW